MDYDISTTWDRHIDRDEALGAMADDLGIDSYNDYDPAEIDSMLNEWRGQ